MVNPSYKQISRIQHFLGNSSNTYSYRINKVNLFIPLVTSRNAMDISDMMLL